MPTSGGLHKAVENGKAIGCTAVQVFTSSPQMWHSKDVTDEMADELQSALEAAEMTGYIVCHDSYLINLCATKPDVKEKSFNALKRELHRSSKLGIPYVVSHLGAHMDQGEQEGIEIAADSVKEILSDTPDDVTLLSETTAGQGTALFYQFEHIAELLNLTGGHPNLGVCLDTCHMFAAGYDISSVEGYNETFEKFDKLIGIERIKAIHANDSKHPLGSRKDRHEHIGDGEIGSECFELLVNDDRFEKVPIVVETPKADEMHAENVKRLWDLIKK